MPRSSSSGESYAAQSAGMALPKPGLMKTMRLKGVMRGV